jgi:hypothetical protein
MSPLPIVVWMSVSAFADDVASLSAPPEPTVDVAAPRPHRARRLRTAGQVITGLGLALIAADVVALGVVGGTCSDHVGWDHPCYDVWIPAVMAAPAVATAGAGGLMWGLGRRWEIRETRVGGVAVVPQLRHGDPGLAVVGTW